MHPSLVILHSDKTAEDTYSVIYMHYIITYRKRCKVIDGKLLAFIHSSSETYTMKTVEYLMVTVAADFVFMINESVMDVASRYEFRHHSPVLGKYGPQPLQLRLLLSIYPHPVSFIHTFADILREKFEILIENRLRSNAELDSILILP